MRSGADSRPDAVAELVRVLRDQVSHHAEHIADLETRLAAANERIAEQQRLLTRLLEKNAAAPPALPLERAAAMPAPGDAPKEQPVSREAREPARPVAPPVPDAVLPEPIVPAPHPPAPPKAAPKPLSPPRTAARPVVRISMGGGRTSQIGAIAGLVLQAAEAPPVRHEFDRSASLAPSISYAPTRGVVRARADAVSPEPETTLTLERTELERGHAALAGRRRWFAFGRRRN